MGYDPLELTKRQGDEVAKSTEPRVRAVAHQLLLLNLVGKYGSEDYVRLKKQFDISKMDYLIGKNIRLLFTITQKYKNLNDEYTDIVSEGFVGFVKAIKTFDPYKNKRIHDRNSLDALNLNKALSTHIGACAENQIKMHARKLRRHAGEVSMSTPIAHDSDGNELTYEEILESPTTLEDMVFEKMFFDKIDEVINKLPPKFKKIAKVRISQYGSTVTQKDLADILGISRSYVSRIERKVENTIKECLMDSEDSDKGK